MRYFILAVIIVAGSTTWAEERIFTVAEDGSGDFKTLQSAIDTVPDNSIDRTIIHLKPGTYPGQTIVGKVKSKVTFEGENAGKTILTYSLNVRESGPEERSPRYRGTGVVILGDDFHAKNITLSNTSGDHGQALALRVDADRAVIENCRLLGWQDTLLLNSGRQYFHDCYLEGRVDFIYGAATVVFDRCEIHSKNGGHITAASTPADHPFGFVFIDCRLTGDAEPWKNLNEQAADATAPPKSSKPLADLGRPWRPYGSVTYLNCFMGDHIKPEGWNNWRNPENEKTARYAEFNSSGPGANSEKRVAWSKQLNKQQADEITIDKVLGGTDGWKPNP